MCLTLLDWLKRAKGDLSPEKMAEPDITFPCFSNTIYSHDSGCMLPSSSVLTANLVGAMTLTVTTLVFVFIVCLGYKDNECKVFIYLLNLLLGSLLLCRVIVEIILEILPKTSLIIIH